MEFLGLESWMWTQGVGVTACYGTQLVGSVSTALVVVITLLQKAMQVELKGKGLT